MKTIIAVLISLSLACMGPADGQFVTGTVYDEQGKTLPDVKVSAKNTNRSVKTNVNGFYTIQVETGTQLVFEKAGFERQEIQIQTQKILDVHLIRSVVQPEMEADERSEAYGSKSLSYAPSSAQLVDRGAVQTGSPTLSYRPDFNTEAYATIHENGFKKVLDQPLSTFSIDVDAASYSNMRRFLHQGSHPPMDAVRIEEMINYFNYNYQIPKGPHPFSINTELSRAPWNKAHYLVQVGLQGKRLDMDALPPSNIVFLLDVSGSMSSPEKLPLLKSSLKMLANELREQDKVSIVVYAGAAGLVLQPTSGSEKATIMQALQNLEAGGSTAGGEGIELAYQVAKEHFVKGGNNRIVLATDGDFNIGQSSDAAMERLIEQKRQEGIFLTVLGFGMGNYKDSKMEILADKGNGNYAYIDTMKEAKKVLVNEFGGTLFTIAKDVKLQVEFNPAVVQAYRLIGYENRLLNDEDFNNDAKDAGELGSGHTVTALYEIIPVGVSSKWILDTDTLKYQRTKEVYNGDKNELLTVKFRYKDPNGETSKLLSEVISAEVARDTSENLRWASAVAGFGMLLRDSEFKHQLTYEQVISLAKGAKGNDPLGYRAEFIQLVELARQMGTQ